MQLQVPAVHMYQLVSDLNLHQRSTFVSMLPRLSRRTNLLISWPAALFAQTALSSVPALTCQLKAGSLWSNYLPVLLHSTASWPDWPLCGNNFTWCYVIFFQWFLQLSKPAWGFVHRPNLLSNSFPIFQSDQLASRVKTFTINVICCRWYTCISC